MSFPTFSRRRLLALAAAGIAGPVAAQPAAPAAEAPSPSAPASAAGSGEWHRRHGLYYRRNWGVDIIGVKPVSSGYMLSFRYRIVDPAKAKLLNERKTKAYLIDEASGTTLAVPAMENIGELRTGTTPQPDRIYFMIFGNPGRLVRSGAKVSIVAGAFRIEGLVVD
jgi:hypothetical protein